jgi:SMI1/KNR4 family protein SUKH-1
MRARIEKRITDLRAAIEVRALVAGKPVPERTLAKAEKALGAPLPPALRTLYRENDGLTLHVVHRGSALEGNLDFLSISRMLGGPEGTRKWDDEALRGALWLDDFADDMSAEVVSRFKRLRPLEQRLDLPPTCVDFSSKESSLVVVNRWTIAPLACTVAEYLDRAVETLGLTGWREPLLAPRSAGAKRFNGDLTRFLAVPAAPAKAPAAGTTAEPAGERVVLSMGHPLFGMDEPRGTVRETKGPTLAVELDAGPTGWVAKRKTTPIARADQYERLRTDGGHWTPLLALGPDALVRTLKPFVSETNASFGPHEILTGAPHLFGATGSLSEDRAAEVLLRLAEILLDDFTPKTRVTPAHQKRFRLMGVLLSALHLRVLHTGLSRGRAGLRETWPASRVAQLMAIGTKCAASSWLPRIRQVVSLIDEVPDASELFFGAAGKTPVVPSPRARTDARTWLDLDKHGS